MHFTLNRSGAAVCPIILASAMLAHVASAQYEATAGGSSIDAAKISIDWDTGSVKAVIGDGQGAVEDAVVAFTASGDIHDVSIVATSTVAAFMDISPSSFDMVEAGEPYSLTIRFKVPPAAAPGVYRGSIRVTSGGQKYNRTLGVAITVDFGAIVIAETTRVITQQTWDELYYAAPDYSVIEFLTIPEELALLVQGDVIVSGVTAQTPFGLIRKVESVLVEGTTMSLTCTDATLSELFTTASISLTKALTPEDAAEGQPPVGGSGPYDFSVPYADVLYDGDDNPGTMDDQVTIAGTINFNSEFSFALGVSAPAMQSASFTSETGRELGMTVNAQSGITDFATNVNLWSRQMKPLTVWARYVPVVFVPTLTLRADVEGDVAAPTQATMTESSSMAAGAAYADNVWQPVSEFSVESIVGSTSAAPGCNVKTRVGLGLDLLVYGVLAATTRADGCLQLQSSTVNGSWWRLYGGIEADLGVSTEGLDGTVVDALFPAIIQYETVVAEGGGTLPPDSGFISGIVRDAVTGAPLPDVHAVAMMAGSPVADDITRADGDFSVAVPAADGYAVVYSRTGYLSATYVGISVAAAQTTYLEVVLQIDEAYEGTGNVGGTIVNALTAAGVPSLTVDLRAGMNAVIGTVVASAATDGYGHYAITDLDAGNYTAHAHGTGYLDAYFTVICLGGLTVENQDGTITPILPSGQTRIVLTWGEVPVDIDSHLTGPLPDETRFHMFYPYAETNQGSLWPDYVLLDLDDTTSYGPETTTMLQQIDGVYRFCVHDFTNWNCTPTDPSFALSNSGAVVRVYRNEGLVAVFAVPPNRSATLWVVFDMEGDAITPVNLMTYDLDELHPDLTSFSMLPAFESASLKNLPRKD